MWDFKGLQASKPPNEILQAFSLGVGSKCPPDAAKRWRSFSDMEGR
jgi:hypothetical protein